MCMCDLWFNVVFLNRVSVFFACLFVCLFFFVLFHLVIVVMIVFFCLLFVCIFFCCCLLWLFRVFCLLFVLLVVVVVCLFCFDLVWVFFFFFFWLLLLLLFACFLLYVLLKSESLFEMFYALIFLSIDVQVDIVMHFISYVSSVILLSCAQYNVRYIHYASVRCRHYTCLCRRKTSEDRLED